METILVAVLGTSPGILTETVWALAMNLAAPVVPHRVEVITTTVGRDMVVRELLTADPLYGGRTVWQAMKDELVRHGVPVAGRLDFGVASLQVFPNADASGHLEDLRSVPDNELAADFILRVVRSWQGEDNCLIGSVAGGRKTMSTLLYAVFSLVGRMQDRLTHVLVNDPFESPGLQPRFYFPVSPPLMHRGHDRQGRLVAEAASDQAVLELADIPFVRVRRLFTRDFGKLPARFTTLVASYNGPEVRAAAAITFDDGEGKALVDGMEIRLPGRSHALFSFLAIRCHAGKPTLEDKADAVRKLNAFVEEWKLRHRRLASAYQGKVWWKEGFDEKKELPAALSDIRTRINALGPHRLGDLLLPQKGPVGFRPREVTVTLT